MNWIMKLFTVPEDTHKKDVDKEIIKNKQEEIKNRLRHIEDEVNIKGHYPFPYNPNDRSK